MRMQTESRNLLHRPKLGRANDRSHRIDHQSECLSALFCSIPRMTKRPPNGRVLCKLNDISDYANIGISQCMFHSRGDGLDMAIKKFGKGILRHP